MKTHRGIRFPWINSRLSSNSRVDRRFLTHERQIARSIGYYLIKDSGISFPKDTLLEIKILICPPDRRGRDDDNILTAFKSMRDGIFKALEMNDKCVRRTILEWGEVEQGGALYVTLREFVKSNA